MFESKTVTAHLARGAIGFAALGGAIVLGPSHPWAVIVALPIALLALRGCPMCWTLGLVQAVHARLRGRPSDAACTDGRCADGRRHRR